MILTFTGRLIDPFELKSKDVSIRDIAHALSQTCRWGGHTSRHYSVAEHCVRLSEYASCEETLKSIDAQFLSEDEREDLAQVLLMHDAAEAYLTDVPKPYKDRPEFRPFVEFERSVQTKIQEFYGIDGFRQVVFSAAHKLDQRIIGNEAKELLPIERMQVGFVRPLPGFPDVKYRAGRQLYPSSSGGSTNERPHGWVTEDHTPWGWTAERAEAIFLDQYTRLFGDTE